MSRRTCCSLVLILVLALASHGPSRSRAQAHERLQQPPESSPLEKHDIAAMTKEAEMILIGQTQSVASQMVTNEFGDEQIVSDVTFMPQEMLKGEGSGPMSLPNVLGGTIGNLRMDATDGARFTTGERAVLFLSHQGADMHPMFGEEGKFEVDAANMVPEMDMSLDAFRAEILSFVNGMRLYLPLVSSTSSAAPIDRHLHAASPVRGVVPEFIQDVRWPGTSPTISYKIHNPGFNDANVGTVEQQNAAIRAAATTWTLQGRSGLTLVDGGTTTISTNTNDGSNVLIVRDAFSNTPGRLAGAYWWSDTSTNTMLDCDVIFFDKNTFSLGAVADAYDIRSVAMEEYGHCVGLAHSGVSGSSISGSGSPNSISDRTLHLDDIGGMQANYRARMDLRRQGPASADESNDRFGATVAIANFIGSSTTRSDLAVGAPGEDANTGAVYLFESVGGTTRFRDPVLVTQVASGGGENEGGDLFGRALAVGNFNGDSLPDLVIGTPGEDIGTIIDVGTVYIRYGTGTGVGSALALRQNPTYADEPRDNFGFSLAVGDFNHDGRDDLAVGAPGEGVGTSGSDAGTVFYYLGTASGLSAPRALSQGAANLEETGDRFGEQLASGDFNHDGFDDLAVGVPGEDYLSSGARAGVVWIFRGSASGLGSQVLLQQNPAGVNEAGDEFGNALASGDFNDDDYDDLAVGAPGEDIEGVAGAGAVFLFSGSASGLGAVVSITQAPFLPNQAGDHFGSALATGDVNSDGVDELAIGVPGQDFGTATDAGAVQIRQFRDDSGNTTTYNLRLSQAPANPSEANDTFGSALAFGRVDANAADLVIGTPGEDSRAGMILVWH